MNTIERIRAFNRFYTNRIGLLDQIPAGLTLTEARILFEIGAAANVNARGLVRSLRLDEGYVSRVLKGLETRGFITRTRSTEDARVFLLGLTEQGVRQHEQLVGIARGAVARMLEPVPDVTSAQMIEAMSTIQTVLSWPSVPDAMIREIGTGDLGWVVRRHGELYAADLGFDMTFEALIGRIVADFVDERDPATEKGWISDCDGVRLGSVFIVSDGNGVARLRLMLVEPFARGKGIGQALLDTAIGHARDRGFEKIVLWTMADLDAAVRLYQRNGFRMQSSAPGEKFGRTMVDQSWELVL